MFEQEVSRPPVTGAGRAALDADTLADWMGDLYEIGRDLPDAKRIDLIRGAGGAQGRRRRRAGRARPPTSTPPNARPRPTPAPGRGHRQGHRPPGRPGPPRVPAPRPAPPRPGQGPDRRDAPHPHRPARRPDLRVARHPPRPRDRLPAREDRRPRPDPRRRPRPPRQLSDKAARRRRPPLAYRLDPHSVVDRRRRAAADRNVTIRPAPDTMTYLTALLPVEQGVAAYAALTRDADTAVPPATPAPAARSWPTPSSSASPDRPPPTDVGVEVRLVITDRALLAGDHEPAHLEGYGPVPAGLGPRPRRRRHRRPRAWFRRLYTAPGTGDLVAHRLPRPAPPPASPPSSDPRPDAAAPRGATPPSATPTTSRTAPAGGKTAAANLDGLCEACNHAKTAPGWHARPRPGPRHTTETTTPTGHTYRSQAPPLPGSEPLAS